MFFPGGITRAFIGGGVAEVAGPELLFAGGITRAFIRGGVVEAAGPDVDRVAMTLACSLPHGICCNAINVLLPMLAM